MRRRFLPPGLLALAALALPGCGGDEGYRLTVHPADGKVVRDGKPVAKAIVRFHPTDPATIALPKDQEGPPIVLTTETDDEGKFALSTYLADDGVPAGDYKVTVAISKAGSDVENADGLRPKAARPVAEDDVENSDGRRRASPKKANPPEDRYRSPDSTTLKATVKPGENHFVFELE